MPNISRQDLDSTTLHLTVTLTREEIKPQLDAEFKKFRKKAVIKGFRPGQAPEQYVRNMYGQSIFVDKFNEMVGEDLYGWLRESKLNVLGQPMPIEDQRRQYTFKIDNPEPEYAVTFEVGYVPEFEITGLEKTNTFERLAISNLDELAAEDLEYARQRMGQRSTPEDNIQENDIIRVAAKELDGDAPKADGWETLVTIFVKNITNEAAKAEVLSKKKGDTFRFNTLEVDPLQDEKRIRKYVLNIPDDQNQPVGNLFEGVIEEVNRVEKAELNEDFFKGYLGEGVESEEQAKEQVKAGIQKFYEERANALLMRSIQEYLMEHNKFPLPDAFLKRWLISTNEGRMSAETIEAEYEPFAQNLRWSMMRDKIKEEADVFVTEAEIRNEFGNRIRQYFQAGLPEEVIASGIDRMMKDKKEVDEIEQNIETEKVFAVIREKISVQDKPIPSKEFQAIIDEVTKKAKAEQEADASLQSGL